jgi:hypothetical protein
MRWWMSMEKVVDKLGGLIEACMWVCVPNL